MTFHSVRAQGFHHPLNAAQWNLGSGSAGISSALIGSGTSENRPCRFALSSCSSTPKSSFIFLLHHHFKKWKLSIFHLSPSSTYSLEGFLWLPASKITKTSIPCFFMEQIILGNSPYEHYSCSLFFPLLWNNLSYRSISSVSSFLLMDILTLFRCCGCSSILQTILQRTSFYTKKCLGALFPGHNWIKYLCCYLSYFILPVYFLLISMSAVSVLLGLAEYDRNIKIQ